MAPCTVYVGRISSEVSDDFVKHLLEKCGKISKWNRAADPNTSKLTSFGFCDFEEPQGVWRALEFLHEKQLCDKKLLVKCEEKAKQTIEKWKATRRADLDSKRKESDGPPGLKEGKTEEEGPMTDEQFAEALSKESEGIAADIARVLKDKNRGYPEVKDNDGEKAEGEKEMAKAAENKEAEKKKEETTKDEKPAAENKRGRSRSGRGRARYTRSEERRREREKEKEREAEEAKKPQVLSRQYRVSRRERDREARVRDRERDIDKEYSYRIREFERGEEKRISNLKRDLRDLELPAEPSERDKRKFIEADLDWGRSEREETEWKRRREERMDKRQREIEKDNADRAAVEKEAEEERKKAEEEERKKRKEEEEAKKRAKEEAEAEKRRQKAEEKERQEEERRKAEEELKNKQDEEKRQKEAETKRQQEDAAAKLLQSISATVQEELRSSTADAASKSAGGGDKNNSAAQAMSALFNAGAPEIGPDGKPKRALQKLGEDAPSAQRGEVKLRDDEMKKLIQQVPTDKARAFAFKINWDVVEAHNIVEKKLRPWVKKKVFEYLGSEEQGMLEFIIRKVNARTSPESILAELEGFLDDEAANFTLKMWRMLIFEVLRVKR